MVLLRGPRLASALVEANEALERGETVATRLNTSLALLRERRDELAEKLRGDTVASAPPEPPRRVWSFL